MAPSSPPFSTPPSYAGARRSLTLHVRCDALVTTHRCRSFQRSSREQPDSGRLRGACECAWSHHVRSTSRLSGRKAPTAGACVRAPHALTQRWLPCCDPVAPADVLKAPARTAHITGGSSRLLVAWDRFAGALATAGSLRGGSALDEQTAATIRGSGPGDRAMRGTRLSGNFVIAPSDLATAKMCAQKAPPRALVVEVRRRRPNQYMSGATEAKQRQPFLASRHAAQV